MSNYTREAQLVAQLEEVKAERDALAAHVERLRDAFQSAVESDWLEPIDQALNQTPTTSLARLKAQWQAEALEQHADYLLDHGQGVARLWAQEHANELRRQAKADQ